VADAPVPVLVLPKEVVPNSIAGIEKDADALLGAGGSRLVVDLPQVEFLSSSGLGYLVLLGKRLHDRGGRLALARPSSRMQRLLGAVGLEGVLPSFSSLENAARHVRGGA
jgi:anti-anti-sigma factor